MLSPSVADEASQLAIYYSGLQGNKNISLDPGMRIEYPRLLIIICSLLSAFAVLLPSDYSNKILGQREAQAASMHNGSIETASSRSSISPVSESNNTTSTILASLAIPTSNTIYVGKTDCHYSTIQSAIDSIINASKSNPYAIILRPGVYNERLLIEKPHIAIIGTDMNSTIIQYRQPRAVQYPCAVVNVKANNVTIENLTIKNTHPFGSGREIALATYSPVTSGVRFKKVNFYGQQDTIYLFQGSYNITFEECYIAGYSDTVSVETQAYFYNCHFYIHAPVAEESFYINHSPSPGCHLAVVGCTFDAATPGSMVANFNSDLDVLYFIGNHLAPNVVSKPFDFRGKSPTIYLFGNTPANYPSSAISLPIR